MCAIFLALYVCAGALRTEYVSVKCYAETSYGCAGLGERKQRCEDICGLLCMWCGVHSSLSAMRNFIQSSMWSAVCVHALCLYINPSPKAIVIPEFIEKAKKKTIVTVAYAECRTSLYFDRARICIRGGSLLIKLDIGWLL